jgi:toxin-antitoxin system PIN domain toxin
MRALLDVNVLIALFDADHIFNNRAHNWLETQSKAGIATCALTENGLVRILTNANYSKKIHLAPPEVIRRLEGFIAKQDHAFIGDSISVTDRDLFERQYILGSKQITDIYLLGLANKAGCKLATFDANINIRAVKAASEANLEVLR